MKQVKSGSFSGNTLRESLLEEAKSSTKNPVTRRGKSASFSGAYDMHFSNGRSRAELTATDLSQAIDEGAGFLDDAIPKDSILKTNFFEKIADTWANQEEMNVRDISIFLLAFGFSSFSVLLYIQPNFKAGKALVEAGIPLPAELLQFPLAWGSVTINDFLNTYLIQSIIHQMLNDTKATWKELDKKDRIGQIKKIARTVIKNLIMAIPVGASTLPYVVLNSSASGDFSFLASAGATAMVAGLYYLMQNLAVQDMIDAFARGIIMRSRPMRYALFPNDTRPLLDGHKDSFRFLKNRVLENLGDILFRYHKLLELEKNQLLNSSEYGLEKSALSSIDGFRDQTNADPTEILKALLALGELKSQPFNPGKCEADGNYNVLFGFMVVSAVLAFIGYNLMVSSVSEDLCKGAFLGKACEEDAFGALFTVLVLLPVNWLVGVYGNKFNVEFMWNQMTQTNKEKAVGALIAPKTVMGLSIYFGLAATLSGGTSYSLIKTYVNFSKPFALYCMVNGWIINAMFNAFPLPLVSSKMGATLYIKTLDILNQCNMLAYFDLTQDDLALLKFHQRIENFIEETTRNFKYEDPTVLAFTIKNLDEKTVMMLMGEKTPSELISQVKQLMASEQASEYCDTWINDDTEHNQKSVFQYFMTALPKNFHEEMQRFEQRRTLSYDIRASASGTSLFGSSNKLSQQNLASATTHRESLTAGQRMSEFSTGSNKGTKRSCWERVCGWGSKGEDAARVPLRDTERTYSGSSELR